MKYNSFLYLYQISVHIQTICNCLTCKDLFSIVYIFSYKAFPPLKLSLINDTKFHFFQMIHVWVILLTQGPEKNAVFRVLLLKTNKTKPFLSLDIRLAYQSHKTGFIRVPAPFAFRKALCLRSQCCIFSVSNPQQVTEFGNYKKKQLYLRCQTYSSVIVRDI